MNKRTAIVTGAYGAIGKAIAAGLASENFSVVLVGRNPDQLNRTREELIRRTGNPDISAEVTDLSLKSEIHALRARWKGSLHLLVNNAATGPRKRTETAEGTEVQWATNVLSYSRMIEYFVPFMKEQPGARIVNVASYWAGGLDFDDVEFRRRRYDNDAAYRQSKQADRMLSAAWADVLTPYDITVNACHPGDVNSKLSNYFGFGGHESPEEGAATPLYLCLSPDLKNKTGGYYEHLRPVRCPFSADKDAVRKLFDLCAGY